MIDIDREDQMIDIDREDLSSFSTDFSVSCYWMCMDIYRYINICVFMHT